MVENFDQRNSFLGLILKQLINEVLIVWFALGTEPDVSLCDFLRNFNWVFAREWRIAMIKFI